MPVRECSVCHGAVSFAAKMPYCPRCGWRTKEVEATLRRMLKLFFVALLFSVAVIFLFLQNWTRQGALSNNVILAIPAIAFLMACISTWAGLRKLRALPPPVFHPPPTQPPNNPASASEGNQ